MIVTLKDVAELAGVSRSAVSRTYTEGASVSLKTREKVKKAALELGYSPNALASSLTTGRTKMIGLVSNNFRNPFFLEVFDLFTRGLQERGLRPLLVNLSEETDPEASIRMLRQYSVDGVIVPCFSANVSGEDRPNHYILISTQSNEVDKDNKCEYFWESEVLIDINSIYNSAGNIGSTVITDNITDEVRRLTNNLTLDVASGLNIFIQNQSFPNSLSSNSGNHVIHRNFIRLSLKIK